MEEAIICVCYCRQQGVDPQPHNTEEERDAAVTHMSHAQPPPPPKKT